MSPKNIKNMQGNKPLVSVKNVDNASSIEGLNEVPSEHEDSQENESRERFQHDFFTVFSDKSALSVIENVSPYFEVIRVNGIPLKMKIDSGAFISAILLEYYNKNFSNILIEPARVPLRAYNKQFIPTVGTIRVKVEHGTTINDQRLYIVNNGGNPIIGRW